MFVNLLLIFLELRCIVSEDGFEDRCDIKAILLRGYRNGYKITEATKKVYLPPICFRTKK